MQEKGKHKHTLSSMCMERIKRLLGREGKGLMTFGDGKGHLYEEM